MLKAPEMARIKSTDRLHFFKCLARILRAHSTSPFQQTKKDYICLKFSNRNKNFKNYIENLQNNEIQFIEMKNTIKMNSMNRLNRTAAQRSSKLENQKNPFRIKHRDKTLEKRVR